MTAPGAQQRLKGFKLHLVAFLVVMVVLVPINYLTTPDRPWFVFPLVGWCGVLAIHVAYVMGLIGRR